MMREEWLKEPASLEAEKITLIQTTTGNQNRIKDQIFTGGHETKTVEG